ncbi:MULTISPECIES: sugar phosphate isomerase/epimerase [unclassified Mesorhizobium]|uniref:sugar phosphate isomerase/epimerase family protein n=1 Tax=unclassified Mesorhizobium TaxID=325217 RepID=UPI0003CE5793|nr:MULTISPECIES: sugar phosphate isomerase/epimerase [unclassified Mesorhizobium]ESX21741.1 epimerase [Mesorhizobium sp. LSJC255A00]ESX30598.1 epimerase [Mesorhizobium sp. LSHC440B00]ESX37231.1 epimerase [Mesorhizobium sp. LSHC432A00]ESX42432.1 epimerase [Mesorhizobium sp. LSHC440A00]ESX77193.1 epimerase [Mesorhizobium sp. LSHC414A00]
MQLGIFARTFATTGASPVLRAVADAGYRAAQFNMACLGLPPMPDSIERDAVRSVAEASGEAGVSIAAVSGTYNMIHPDRTVRIQGLARLEVLAASCADMGTRLITLCTGTRDAQDQWRWHPDNASEAAWSDLRTEMEAAIAIAERFDIELGIEPELANVLSSARAARRLLDEMNSTRLRIVLDPANLFEVADSAERHRLIDEAIDLLAAEIGMAHAKDRHADGSFAAAGKGVVDFPHFIGRLKAAGFDGPLITHGLTEAEAPGVGAFLRTVLEGSERA